jgi:hypothetical protein
VVAMRQTRLETMTVLCSLRIQFHKWMRFRQDLLSKKAVSELGGDFLPAFPGLNQDKDRQWPIRLHASHNGITHLAYTCHLIDIMYSNNIRALGDADSYGGRRSFQPLVAGWNESHFIGPLFGS